MKNKLAVIILGLFLLPTFSAWECEWGEMNAWVKFYGENEWRNALIKNITLKTHEPFYVKIEIKTKTECYVTLKLSEPGSTPAFEVIEGPSEIWEIMDLGKVPSGWSKIYEWTIRPTKNWSGGYAPLNARAQFTKIMNFQQYDRSIHKTIIYAYISSEKWKGNEGRGKESHKEIPGFAFSLLTLAFLIMWIIRRNEVP